MRKNNLLQQKLKEILSEKRFEELEPFKNTKSWKTLNSDDRQLLGSLFVMLGEKQLAQGDQNADESFDLATKVTPDNHDIFCRIGTAYAKVDQSLPSLKTAEIAFNHALKLQPLHFNSLVGLGNIYTNMGAFTNDSELFIKAQELFLQAREISQKEAQEEIAHLHWHWGVSEYFLGKYSGEAVDFYSSLDKFQKAAEMGLQDKFFWIAYGDALAELACLLGKDELFLSVVELYRNGVRQAFDFFEGWLSLGCTFHKLFDSYYAEDYFHQASECFKMASQINDNSSILWLKWAQLLATNGKIRHDLKLLGESFEKYAKADNLEPNSSLILGLWGEAMLLYGAQKEDIETLRLAQHKIMRSLEINSESPETWYIYGCSFYELGRYFNQEDYYHQAIDKFQFGLSIKQNEPLLWYGLAIAYYAIGDIRSDVRWLEKSTLFFSRILEFKGHGFRPMWNDWGVTLMRLAEITGEKSYIEAAIEKFEQVVPRNPEKWEEEGVDLEWLYNYGCALDFLGDFTEEIEPYELAIQALSKVVQNDPEYTNARYNLALSLAHLADVAKDVESFHKSIEQFQILLTQDREDEMGWCDYGLTIIHLAQLIHDPIRPEQTVKFYEIAESKLMQSVALGSTQAFYHLACLHSLQGNYAASIHFLERAEATGMVLSLDQILHDEWLDGVRATPSFRTFINHLTAKHYPENKAN